MDQNLMKRQRELTDRLNRYRNEYYNLNSPSVSDAVYDRLFEELQALEKQTGIQMANSPTSTVGYPAVSKLEKTSHPIPLLSLDKVKNTEELCRFMGEHQVMFMLKLDGLTIKLTYEGGKLVEAATRGDGDVGEIVTHNTRAISGIPAHIQYEDRLVVTGEAFIRPSDFEQLKTTLVDGDGKPYKNGRNLAAGSVRLFDAGACMGRRLQFMPFNVLEGMEEVPRKSERLKALRPLGFLPCKYMVTKRPLTQEETEEGIRQLKQYAADADIPIDGMDIPMVGNTASRVLCREFHGSLDEFRDAVYGGYDFRQLPDFGETLHNNIREWFNEEENFCIWEELQMMMKIQKPAEADNQTAKQDNPFSGMTVVVTGKVEPYTRDEMNSLIASLGAVAGSSVTRKTNYLVCGEKAGSKLSKARELGIPVLTPKEFFRMAGVA